MLFIVVYCRPMVGEVGHHNMHTIGKPRLCENSIWCLDPRVRIRIRYGSGSENYGSGATLRPTNSVKALKGKHHIPWNCLPQAHLEVFQLCLWPPTAPGYLEGGLPCLSSALWYQGSVVWDFVQATCSSFTQSAVSNYWRKKLLIAWKTGLSRERASMV